MLNKLRPLTRQIIGVQANRGYLTDLGLDSNSLATRDPVADKKNALELWKAQVDS